MPNKTIKYPSNGINGGGTPNSATAYKYHAEEMFSITDYLTITFLTEPSE